MKKKIRSQNILIGSILIVLLSVIFYFGVLQSSYGYTSLSISNVEIDDVGSRIRIYGVANGAEDISVTFNKEDINKYINKDDYQATKDAVMHIQMDNPTRKFKLTKETDKTFYELDTFELGILKNCKNNLPSGVSESLSLGRIGTTLCAYYVPKGIYSTFSSGLYIDKTPVTFTIDGAYGILEPSSGNNVVVLNDGKTKIEWVGNLVNFQGLDTPDYAVLYTNNFDKLINQNSWSSYETSVNSFKDCVNSNSIGWGSGFTDLVLWLTQSNSESQYCINNYNNRLNTFLVDKTSDYENSANIKSLNYESDGMVVGLKTATVFPSFIITLDASKVGIIELGGEPKIQECIPDKEIFSGDTYSTSVLVKNIADCDGNFYGQITCSGQSEVIGTISEQLVKSKQTVNLPVQISGVNLDSGVQNNNCVVKIIDRKTQKYDTCSFNLKVKHQENIVCTPNSYTCKDVDTLKKCNDDGSDFELIDCDEGCIVLESGEAQCKGEDPIPNASNTECENCDAFAKCQLMGMVFKNLKCESPTILGINTMNSTICMFSFIKLAIIPFIFIFSLLYGSNIYKSFIKKKKNNWIVVLLSLSTAILISYLIYIMFYIGIILAAVYIIINILVKTINPLK